MENIMIYLAAALCIIAAISVISSTNPIYSVFYLILVFLGSAALLLMINADFLAMIFLVVYVGAIAVLFLFVVMMLNLNLATLNENLLQYLPIGFFIGIFFLYNTYEIIDYIFTDPMVIPGIEYINWSTSRIEEIRVIGEILYTYYLPYFIIASLILFVAMIGAIVLTTHPSHAVRRQDIHRQLIRDYNTTIIMKKC